MTVTTTKPEDSTDTAVSAPAITAGLPVRELRVADRCDAECPAQAHLRAWKAPYEHELLFCRHHGRKHYDALTMSGFEIDDQSERLTKNTKPDGGSAAG